MLDRFRRLWTRPDPTADWPPCRPVPLTLTLPDAAVNGIGLGDNYASLRAFGRPTNAQPATTNRFVYAPLGLTVEGQHDVIEYFEFTMVADDPAMPPCDLTLVEVGQEPMRLWHDTHRSQIEARWGAPQQRHDHDEEVVDWYDRGAWLLEVTWSEGGWLLGVSLERVTSTG